MNTSLFSDRHTEVQIVTWDLASYTENAKFIWYLDNSLYSGVATAALSPDSSTTLYLAPEGSR
jgi:hypothetical protein